MRLVDFQARRGTRQEASDGPAGGDMTTSKCHEFIKKKASEEDVLAATWGDEV